MKQLKEVKEELEMLMEKRKDESLSVLELQRIYNKIRFLQLALKVAGEKEFQHVE